MLPSLLAVLLPQLGQDVGVALQPVVGEQAVGAVFDAPAHHKAAPAVGHPVEGAVAEEAVEFLLPHTLVAGEVFTFFVLKPGVVLAGHVHGGISFQMQTHANRPRRETSGGGRLSMRNYLLRPAAAVSRTRWSARWCSMGFYCTFRLNSATREMGM